MTNFWESNLRQLQTYDPALAKRLHQVVPSGRVEIFQTPHDQLSLRVKRDPKPWLLHSGQDPAREAERWAAGVAVPSPYNLLVMGCGLLHHVYALVKIHLSTLRNLVIVEKDWEVVRLAFTHLDLTPYLQTRGTFFLVDPTPAEIRAFFNRHLTPFVLDGISLIEHPASCQLYPAWYADTRRLMEECLESGEMLLRTKVQLGGMIQENIIRNIPHLLAGPSVAVWQSLLAGVPAFVIGAGPSLDRSLEALAPIGNRGVVIACDTVLKPLRERGIDPHLVVSTDPTALNVRHFEGIGDSRGTVLVYSPSVSPEIPRKWKGAQVSIPLATSRLLRLLYPPRNAPEWLKPGTNVGQTAFNLARFMGCDPIALVGLDFSFPREGGTTHASGTAWRRKIVPSPTPGKMFVELISEQPTLEEFEPILIPGNRGDTVATNKFFLAYLRSMEEEIRATPSRVVNASDGARIEGAEAVNLPEFIRETCIQDWPVADILRKAVDFYFGGPADESWQVLTRCLEVLEEAVQQAGRGLRLVEALETVARSPAPRRENLREILNEITEAHRALIQEHRVYAILDEAADRVLHPFLRQDSRPLGEPTDLANVAKTVARYRPFFQGMDELCGHYARVIRETVEQLRRGAGMGNSKPPFG